MNKMRMLVSFTIASNIMAYGQSVSVSNNNDFDNRVSIYEYGDPLISCETNFVNLFRNWNSGYITNASQYNHLDTYAFIETISDSARYRYYRNYFSGLDVISFSWTSTGSTSYKGKQRINKHSYFIEPYNAKWALLEQVPIETMVKLVKLYNAEINIDTIKLNTVSQEFMENHENKHDSASSHIGGKLIADIWAYSDSATKKCIDSMFLHKVRFENLSLPSQESLLIARALLFRVAAQKSFNEAVHIGDKVYVVPFEFGAYHFKIFVICNPISKKVVMDTFFKNIQYK